MKIKNKILVIMSFFTIHAKSQEITKQLVESTITSEKLQNLIDEYGSNKKIPDQYKVQILKALSYFPELKSINIEFRVKNAKSPLAARPKLIGLLQSAKKRKYIITISEKTNPKLESILLKNLNFNAQVGVLGHELSHISDYINKGFSKMCHIVTIEITSKNKVDKLERATDLICIQHGLGYQLLEWSNSVRQNLKIENWRGANNAKYTSKKERYLNPNSIKNSIKELPIYK